MSATHRSASLARGFLDALPLTPGVVMFGLVYGVAARAVGLSPVETAGMSAIVHAGSSQFAALGMWLSATPGAIVLTTLIINLRHLLMGASVAPYLRHLPLRWKMLLALWMSDESYATAIAAYERGRGSEWHFLGANLCIWIVWWPSGLAGALAGQSIPDLSRYGLEMVFPLAFIGLAASFFKGRASAVAAGVAAVTAVLGAVWLPGNWHIIGAGLLGSLAGLAAVREGGARS
ncbi:MAG: AzlC family ABC transporter permease [Anaerolineae bacterium]|nr:AzlC family ABC transporter permease [Anaerolineae bacterium]